DRLYALPVHVARDRVDDDAYRALALGLQGSGPGVGRVVPAPRYGEYAGASLLVDVGRVVQDPRDRAYGALGLPRDVLDGKPGSLSYLCHRWHKGNLCPSASPVKPGLVPPLM